jgi:hypothetical protein
VADLATPAKSETAAAGSTPTQGTNLDVWYFAGILAVLGTGVALFFIWRGETGSTPESDTEPKADAESDRAGAIEPRDSSHADADDRFRT